MKLDYSSQRFPTETEEASMLYKADLDEMTSKCQFVLASFYMELFFFFPYAHHELKDGLIHEWFFFVCWYEHLFIP